MHSVQVMQYNSRVPWRRAACQPFRTYCLFLQTGELLNAARREGFQVINPDAV